MTKQTRPEGKKYEGTLPPQVKLEKKGDSFQGVFVGRKISKIKGDDVWVYTFKNELDERFAYLGRTHLDRIMDEMFEDMGDDLPGQTLYIERLSDIKIPNQPSAMGQYLVIVVAK